MDWCSIHIIRQIGKLLSNNNSQHTYTRNLFNHRLQKCPYKAFDAPFFLYLLNTLTLIFQDDIDVF